MESIREEKEFNVLGYKIKFTPDESEASISADEVVSYVQQITEEIRQKSPQLDIAQVATLAALKVANEKLSIEKDFENNISRLHTTACDALQFIEEVSPSTI
ncbi:cell division protein ZapA [Halobacteriovorax marinus]|uniref:Cell division protein ZapA n=1 Tax=Halobacteriovorax marinus (strain ATCC BAA-682 / DSM 15412 / SJ) TaxID=862908 RepID=E1X012_HALMS|nr:cell division protein ZapA [Halobacteriovorax marinus]ATH09220.1 cell division protein ZapA [Halobacteriovorax marinus]CBW27948.1 hypothetical protein BMS_3195 [Halobacteriovorax marinus SJ]